MPKDNESKDYNMGIRNSVGNMSLERSGEWDWEEMVTIMEGSI